MTEKEKRQQRHNEEDAVFNRLLIWLAGIIVAEAIVLFVKRFYIDVTARDFDFVVFNFLSVFFGIFMYLGLVMTIAGIIWCLIARKKGLALQAPGIITAFVAFIWIISVVARVLGEMGVKVLMLLPIVAAVLILIYFLYQRAFFVNAIISGLGIAGLWFVRQYFNAHSPLIIALVIVGVIVLVAISVFAFMLKKNEGKLNGCQYVEDSKSYAVCWLTCAVVAVAAVLAVVFGAGFAFFLMYVLIGWLFCLAVYYTVKLI